MKIAATLVAVAGLSAAASAQTATVESITDFSVHNVGENLGGFFGNIFTRNADDGRFQVNGRDPNPASRVLGLWSIFNIDGGSLFANPISDLDSVRINLPPATPRNPGTIVPSFSDAGNLQVFYTTDQRDVLDSSNGFDWIDSDPSGLGNQFSDLTQLGEVNLPAGDPTAFFDIALSGTVQSDMISAINNGELVRFIFTTSTVGLASNWGLGVPSDSTTLPIEGDAATVQFVVPSPAGAAVLGRGGLVALRRRRA